MGEIFGKIFDETLRAMTPKISIAILVVKLNQVTYFHLLVCQCEEVAAGLPSVIVLPLPAFLREVLESSQPPR